MGSSREGPRTSSFRVGTTSIQRKSKPQSKRFRRRRMRRDRRSTRRLWRGVVAIVAPQPGSPLDKKQIQSAIASDLAQYKQPKRVFVTTDISRNAMGKIHKKDLRETYNATFRAT